MSVHLTKLLPQSIRQPMKEMMMRRQLRRAIDAIRKVPEGQIPDRQLLSDLIEGWGNQGYAAKVDYLAAVAKSSVNTPGPVLECGSGATTLLMGVLCGRRNIEVWTLEHSREWLQRVEEALMRNHISGVHVCESPLVEYGDFVWYDPPLGRMPKEFSLVICDGPPGVTKGNRYGLLPVMGNRVPAGSTILLDDAERPGELEVIQKWEHEATFQTDLFDNQGRKYAVMRRSA